MASAARATSRLAHKFAWSEFEQPKAGPEGEGQDARSKDAVEPGQVERFNGRISDVLKSHHFRSSEELAQTLLRYVHLYNQQLPQSALKSRSPVQTMKDWFKTHPELFHKRPYNGPGCDN